MFFYSKAYMTRYGPASVQNVVKLEMLVALICLIIMTSCYLKGKLAPNFKLPCNAFLNRLLGHYLIGKFKSESFTKSEN